MQIKFILRHVIRHEHRSQDFAYEEHQVVDFRGWVAETYARAYIQRGYAVAWDCDAKAAEEQAKADRAREASEWLSRILRGER